LDITDPEERAALEREFESLTWQGKEQTEESGKTPPLYSPPVAGGQQQHTIKEQPSPQITTNQSDVPNKLLLAEMHLLRREMRNMQQAHTAEIAALKALVMELLKKKMS